MKKVVCLLVSMCIVLTGFSAFAISETENVAVGEDEFFDELVFDETDAEEPIREISDELVLDEDETMVTNGSSPFTYSVVSEEDKTIRTTGFTPGTLSGAVEVPEEIDGYTVVGLGNATFGYNNGEITSIKVPDTVRRIEDVNCFYCCAKLSEVILPEEMDYIGVGAFSGCKLLTSIVIPKGVPKLEKMFRGCTSLKEVTIPSSVTFIDAYSFASTIGGTDIMPGVTIRCAIGSYAEQFAKANGIPVKYSDGPLYSYIDNGDGTITITDIADDVEIAGTLAIPETYDGKTVTGIGDSAFEGNNKLTNVSLPDTITSIGEKAFANCKNISVFEIPDGVEELDKTFMGCTSLETITIPESVTNIKEETFYNKLKTEGGAPLRKVVIYCKKGSAAEEYAKKYSIEYEAEGPLPDAWDGTIDTSWYDSGETEFSISTPAQLAGLRELVNNGVELFYGKTVTLEDDINFTDTVWKVGIGYKAGEGDAERRFNGTFKGNYHKIVNFTYNSNAEFDTAAEALIPDVTSCLCHGFFGNLGVYGKVENLGFENASVTAGNTENKLTINVGTIAGANNGTITHCYVDGIKLGGGYWGSFCSQTYGGVCGSSAGTLKDIFVKNVDFTNVVAQINAAVKGGVTASSSGSVQDCYVCNLIYNSGDGYYQWDASGQGTSKCPIMFYYDPVVKNSNGNVTNVYATDTFMRNGWNVGERSYTDFHVMTDRMKLAMEKLTFRTMAATKTYLSIDKVDGNKTEVTPNIYLEFSNAVDVNTIGYDTVFIENGDEVVCSVEIKDKDDENYPRSCTVIPVDELNWRESYEITVNGVKDLWYRDVVMESLSFDTADEINFTDFALYENYGKTGQRKLTSLSGVSGPVTAVISGMKNNGTKSYDAIFSIGAASDGQILKGAAKKVNIFGKETKSGDVVVGDIDISSCPSSDVKLQAVLYKSFTNPVPLVDSVQVSR